MDLDWRAIDRYLIGESWANSKILDHAQVLCEKIGPRWSSSEAESKAIRYIYEQMMTSGLDCTETESFNLHTWSYNKSEALKSDGKPFDLVPFNFCQPCKLKAPLVDVGFGTFRELGAETDRLNGSIAIMNLSYEPFTTPIPHSTRLEAIAKLGAVAVVCVDPKTGRRAEYHNSWELRNIGIARPPLPAVTTSKEHGIFLRHMASKGEHLQLTVESQFYDAPSANVVGHLTGTLWPQEHIVLGGHHDTVLDTPGGNDNASGTIAVLETGRVLAALKKELGVSPGRNIRFVTFSAEEQAFQGAIAYILRHYGPEQPPHLVINLDELSTGHFKGIVLAFPHLQDFVQAQLNTMDEALQCYVMAQLDTTSDHFPFLQQAIDTAHLWRWRFHGRHAESDYHHEEADTMDKLNIRELKEYVGQLARLLLRLSHQPSETWPDNPLSKNTVQKRLDQERGTAVRLY